MYHLLFVYSYLIYGLIMMIKGEILPLIYLFCLAFASFKVTTNYRVCSVAYLECKLRDVKRNESYMNKFLDPIVDLRYTDHIYILTLLSFIILTYNFVYLKRFNEFKEIQWN